MPRQLPQDIDETHALLSAADYVADRSLATALYLALRMQRQKIITGVNPTKLWVVLDESTRFKNQRSKRGQSVSLLTIYPERVTELPVLTESSMAVS